MTTLNDLNALQNVSSLSDVATVANNWTSGVLFFGFSIVLFLVLLLAFKRFAFAKGFMAASWIMFILTSILWFGGFMAITYPIIYLVLSVVGVIIVWLE